MFNDFLNNLPQLITEAKQSKYVQEDKKEIFNFIYDYIKKNNLIVSNIHMFSNTKPNNLILYGHNILFHANNLANEISKINIYTKLYTIIKNEEFSITLEGTLILYFYNIKGEEFKYVNFVKLNNITFTSPYFEAIEIYNVLYNPSKFHLWESYIELEKDYKKYILKNTIDYKEKKKTVDEKITELLNKRNDYILIGKCAIDVLNDKKICSVIQIISNFKTVNELSKILKCHIMEYNNILKTESRLTKYILYKNKDGKKESVMIIYNNLDYEMIPFTIYKNFHIAYLDVIACHLFIDIFNSRVYKDKKIINTITQESLWIYKLLDTVKPERYYRDKYLGVNYSRESYKKSLGKESNYFPYIPEQYRYLKGNYRVIQ